MQRNTKRGILLIAAVTLILALTGCGTLTFGFSSRDSGAPVYPRGQAVEILGRVVLDKRQVMLEDQNSPVVFRFVGLRPDDQRALSGLAGEVVRVQLKVISTQSAHAYNAQFVRLSGRQ